ncbi:ABC transporter permease [Alkalicoccobacillus porphyridii]|uniref:ABC transporter permease n=1 Tax=Alkalicoccobacillus porphyridii TaxID=2597270 RepID=A0A554A1D7_9BACI|nr:ABC transporter permease [Alkalicoccobacillus porphyridii]TSB47456.1 ABC transporter permease [Alkalicoccobacillus porphyridii]
MNIQRISAIFEKDMRDFMKNMMLLVMPGIPIAMALLYGQLGEDAVPIEMIYIIVGSAFSAVTSAIMMTMMAEENEKNTLRGLIQSPASFVDILIGKSLVTAIITFVALTISLVIIDIDPFLDFRVMIGLLLLFLFFLLLGIGIGLFSNTLASTSVYLMPVMFLFGFTPLYTSLGVFDEDSIITTIFSYFPILQAIEIHDSSSWLPLGILSLWVIGSAIFVIICFKKTTTDD